VGCGLVGAGIELATQMLAGGKRLGCIDWSSVTIEALSGCAGGAKFAAKLAKLLKRWVGCNSFTADTVVHTENGLQPISELKIGDKVLSYDERTETSLYQPVMDVIQGEKQYHLIKLTLESGESIETTAEHPSSDADIQIQYLNSIGCVPIDELGLEFDDITLLICSKFKSGNLALTEEQYLLIKQLNEKLEQMNGENNAALWTESELIESKEWKQIRTISKNCLSVFDHV